MALQLTSSAFEHMGHIPIKYTCDGEDINPPLSFLNVPKQAQSLVLVMSDPDAPFKIWDHWLVYDIAADYIEIPENVGIFGHPGKGTNGNMEYDGPCPPSGEHRYIFKVYALDTILNLPEGLRKKEIEEKMRGHVIETASLIGLYER